jgi:hypothetical protein
LQSFFFNATLSAMLAKLEDKLVALDWKAANDNVDVKLLAEDKELYVLAKSKDRRAKERAMRKYKLRRYLSGLAKLRSKCRQQMGGCLRCVVTASRNMSIR